MLWKKRLNEKSPDISWSVLRPSDVAEQAKLRAAERPAKPKIAVFITHGMGQQIPFETLDSAVEGLTKAAARHGKPVQSVQASTVLLEGGIKTQRAEFDMRDALGRDVEVHVYEGYWAPITEGKVTLRDVTSFLLRAGWNGLLNCRLQFERWIFGRAVTFGTQFGATSRLLGLLFVLLSLMVLNAFTTVVAGDKILHKHGDQSISDAIFGALTSTVAIYLLASLVIGGALALLMFSKRWIKQPSKSIWWRAITWAMSLMISGWALLTVISAIMLVLVATGCIESDCLNFLPVGGYWYLGIWGVLFAASWYIRKLFVQYMGDVAVYVDSHTLDRFDDMRKRIKARVFDLAKAVYSDPQYEHVALVGHSLGSVITYDTLNALINHDELNGKILDAAKRTKLMLTFGSPLDKTAFIFAAQIDTTTETREALAATLQPLIQEYVPYRDVKWINIHSPRDIISGALDFYDDPKAKDFSDGRKVHNIVDEDSMIPLVAHTEYWNNAKVFDALYLNL